jgi:hypothetical protein
MRKTAQGKRMPKPGKIPADFYAVISTCWLADPHKRPDFAGLQASFKALLKKYRVKKPRDIGFDLKHYKMSAAEIAAARGLDEDPDDLDDQDDGEVEDDGGFVGDGAVHDTGGGASGGEDLYGFAPEINLLTLESIDAEEDALAAERGRSSSPPSVSLGTAGLAMTWLAKTKRATGRRKQSVVVMEDGTTEETNLYRWDNEMDAVAEDPKDEGPQVTKPKKKRGRRGSMKMAQAFVAEMETTASSPTVAKADDLQGVDRVFDQDDEAGEDVVDGAISPSPAPPKPKKKKKKKKKRPSTGLDQTSSSRPPSGGDGASAKPRSKPTATTKGSATVPPQGLGGSRSLSPSKKQSTVKTKSSKAKSGSKSKIVAPLPSVPNNLADAFLGGLASDRKTPAGFNGC